MFFCSVAWRRFASSTFLDGKRNVFSDGIKVQLFCFVNLFFFFNFPSPFPFLVSFPPSVFFPSSTTPHLHHLCLSPRFVLLPSLSADNRDSVDLLLLSSCICGLCVCNWDEAVTCHCRLEAASWRTAICYHTHTHTHPFCSRPRGILCVCQCWESPCCPPYIQSLFERTCSNSTAKTGCWLLESCCHDTHLTPRFSPPPNPFCHKNKYSSEYTNPRNATYHIEFQNKNTNTQKNETSNCQKRYLHWCAHKPELCWSRCVSGTIVPRINCVCV